MAIIYLDADKCPLCRSSMMGFDSRTNEFYCKDCGYVAQDQIFHVEKKFSGKAEKVFVNPKSRKIAIIINSMLRTEIERKMAPFERMIEQLELNLSMSRAVRTICRKALEKKLTLGNSRNTLLAAAVYAAGKQQDTPVILADLEAVLDVGRVKIMRVYKKLCRYLKLNQRPQSPDSLMLQLASRLDIRENITTKAIKLAKELEKKIRNPLSLAAVSLYTACKNLGQPIKQKDCADVAGINIMTLERNLKKV